MTLRFGLDSITPTTGGGGGGSANIESLSITPSTSAQTITASGGVDGYSPVNVSAVTASIDANITAGNIKKDVQILGVTGTYEGGGSAKYGATINTLLGDVDANGVLQEPSVYTNLVFDGVKDIGDYALYCTFYEIITIDSVSFPDLTEISGYSGCQQMLQKSTSLTTVDLSSLTTVSGENGCYRMFAGCNGLTTIDLSSLTTISGNYGCGQMFDGCSALTSVSLPNLTTISGENGCDDMFSQCNELTTVDLSSLTTISGEQGCYRMFYYCSALTSVSLPNLTTISGSQGCYSMFWFCTALTDVYFPALTTSSFGAYTNQLQYMMNGTGSTTTHTLHFPSNLESTIQGLASYPLFGGTSGYVVLAFDLPATE